MSTKRKVHEITKEDGNVEWFVYPGGTLPKGANYTHIRVKASTPIVAHDAFENCKEHLRVVEICEGVAVVGNAAFYECKYLESIEFPSTLTIIYDFAFRDCTSLKRIVLHEGLESIGRYAFYGCESLESINLPSTPTSIGDRAFMECKSLKSIEIPSSVTRIGFKAFSGCKALKNVIFHEGVVSIGGWAFHKCASIKCITLPLTLQAIELGGTFSKCVSLESIDIPPSVTRIGYKAFSGCTKLKKLTFQSPHHLRTIDAYAFQYCLALEEIKFPPSITELYKLVFYCCKNLKKVDLCGGSPRVPKSAFYNCRKLDRSNIIATGKMNFETFWNFARADLSSRIASMADERKAIINEKLDSIPDQIDADSDSSGDDGSNSESGSDFGEPDPVGRIPQTMQDRLAMIHGLITYWELKEPLTILELAIWKLNLFGSETDVKSRQQIRRQCGQDMQVIISGVLQFFDYNTNEDVEDSVTDGTEVVEVVLSDDELLFEDVEDSASDGDEWSDE